MQFFTLPVALSLLPAVLASYGYGSSDSSTTAAEALAATTSSSSSTPTQSGVHVVKVGDGSLTFSPNNLKAAVGDKVEFHFWPQQHSVAQSSFDKPCEPLNVTAGFFSGPVRTASGMNENVYTITINNTNPIWYYCAAQGHCNGGMAGVINAPASGARTIEQYIAAAKDATLVVPSSVKGGVLAAAVAGTGSPTSTATGASASESGNAGIETRGTISWGLLALTGAMAAGVGGLLA